MQSMVTRKAVYLVTEAVILSKQLKGKYELLFPAQIFFFFAKYKPLPLVRTYVAQPNGFRNALSSMFQKQYGKEPLLLRSREFNDPDQQEHSQIENAKQNVRLNSNQRAIQPLATVC